MTSEHTFAAAPWEAQEEHGKYVVRSPEHGLIADVFPWRTAEANARLIAAAPELLEALMGCVGLLGAFARVVHLEQTIAEGLPPEVEPAKEVARGIKEARAAIAKALGQPQ